MTLHTRSTSPEAAAQRAERRFRWLVGLSLIGHLIFTPVAGWLGLASHWFEADVPPPEYEELDAIPLDLIEDAPEDEKDPSALPERDPVALIDKLVPGGQPVTAPSQPAPEPSAPAASSAPATSVPVPSASAAPSAPTVPPTASAPPLASTPPSATAPEEGDAGVPPPTAKAPQGDVARQEPKPRRSIENPVALAGKASQIVKSNSRLQLIVYTEKLRGHPIGERVGLLLPRLPQWSDFFGSGVVNPVRDFDRIFMAGPNFHYSDQIVVGLEYNTKRELIVAAIDALVKRQGKWRDDFEVPTAEAFVDRGKRLFVVPKHKIVWVLPVQRASDVSRVVKAHLPRSQGPEAMVAMIREPHKSLWRLGLAIPESVHDLKLRVTPLEGGAVKLELSALETDAEAATRTSRKISQDINDLVDGLAQTTGLLGRVTLGLVDIPKLPRVQFESRGQEIWAETTLTGEQANYVMGFVERQMAALLPKAAPPAPAGTSKKPKP